MLVYNIFIDESGTAKPDTYSNSPYFSLSGVMISNLHREKLREELDNLKLTYFGRKSYVLHSSSIRYHLRQRNKSLSEFSKDLKVVLEKCYFSLLCVVVDKENAHKKGFDVTRIYTQTYKILLGNMLKFLAAKQIKGQIFAEASNSNQDIHLYDAFFHLIRRGIDRLGITHEQAREHFTCLSFVTKLNNDPEEQLSDLFGMYGRIKMEIYRGIRKEAELDALEHVVFNLGEKRLFSGNAAKLARKRKLYSEINAFKIWP